ncbi:DUF6776 family protein [Glaciecola siphonariae]|uniref:DUF6776 family protein n=1 Tax=Glaciecola siphonariae TaxID=521012 RepID=A0ABV9LWI2_9ALTE
MSDDKSKSSQAKKPRTSKPRGKSTGAKKNHTTKGATKPAAKPPAKPAAKPAAKSTKPPAKPAAKNEAKPADKPEDKPVTKPEASKSPAKPERKKASNKKTATPAQPAPAQSKNVPATATSIQKSPESASATPNKPAPSGRRLNFVKDYGLMLGALGICFYLGFASATWYDKTQSSELNAMKQSIANLTQENQTLHSRMNTMEIELDVAKLANEQHQKRLLALNAQENTLKEQLGFYQRIMAPELSQDGFMIEGIEVLDTTNVREYTLNFVMLQREKLKGVIKGNLQISLSGTKDDTAVRYNLSDLASMSADKLSYSFKYFEVVSINFTLPEDFLPQALEIETSVYRYKTKQGDYSTSILWQDAYNE